LGGGIGERASVLLRGFEPQGGGLGSQAARQVAPRPDHLPARPACGLLAPVPNLPNSAGVMVKGWGEGWGGGGWEVGAQSLRGWGGRARRCRGAGSWRPGAWTTLPSPSRVALAQPMARTRKGRRDVAVVEGLNCQVSRVELGTDNAVRRDWRGRVGRGGWGKMGEGSRGRLCMC
jgi:hypothetical protein